MLGTAIATCISDIPFDGPCAMTQVGMKDGEFILNPSQEIWDNGDLSLTVASTAEKVIMILPSRLLNPPGILPTAYNFSSYSTLQGKKSMPSLGFSLAVAVDNTVVSP